jgi:cysteinyl-tRNA synthetase
MQHRLNQNEEKYARKNRWAIKVEKEEDRTRSLAEVASERARSVREAIDSTLNKKDAVHEYKSLMTKIDNTCITNLKKIEENEE